MTTTAARIAASIAEGPHRMTVGLRPLDPARWIEDAPDHNQQLQEKWRLLAMRDDVVAALPDTRDAQHEVLNMLAEHLPRRFAQRYSRDGEAIHVAATGATVALHRDDDAPLARAARLVPEDLCLMRADDGGRYVLAAAALCFPTRWRLAEKLGRPIEYHPAASSPGVLLC